MKLHNIASRCLCLLTGVALFTACDNETDFADPNNRDGKPLRIETSIAETRAVVTSTNFAEGDRVGLFVLDDGGQVYADNAMNQPATYNASGWSMENEIVLSKKKTPYVFAVYPYYGSADYIPVDINMRMSINIAPNQYEGIEGQADWMYANALPLEGNTAKLTFRHALARVTLQLKRDADETGDGLLTKVRMQNAMKYDANNAEQGRGTDLCTTGWMSLRNGSINTEETKNAESYIEQTTEMGLSAEAQTINFLVIPTALPGQTNTPDANTTGGGIEVLFTIDGKQYRVDLGVPTWHAGQQYIYPITINRNSAEVTPDIPVAEAVDLGLSVKWASFNVGATKPEEYGGYYAWGETEEQELYSYQWTTYKWCEGTEKSMTKYCTSNEYGTVDNKTILDPEDDVAYAKWGDNWRMPTSAEFQELIEKCTWTWTEQNGSAGYIVSASNGNSIFLPAAGASGGQGIFAPGELGNYWVSTLYTRSFQAYAIFFSNTNYDDLGYSNRANGLSVRPVYGPQATEPIEPELTPTEGAYIDLGLPSGTLWASCNVGANSPEEAGGYYAWGETEEKEDYSWGTYNWGTGTFFTKYCTDSSYGTVDGKTTLEPEDDVAYMVLGSEWRMPTQTEVQELQEYCTWTLGEYKGCAGYLIEGSNGNCIFLPFAGAIYDNEHHYESEGYYWTATLGETTSGILNYFNTNSKYYNLGYQRYYGMTVRPIYDPQPTTEPVAEAVDLGLSVKWASFNVGATNPEEYGGYYAWGETEEREDYGESSSLTYDLSESELQSRGIIGTNGNLTASYDVASTKWGNNWRMPTQAEIEELRDKCTWKWTTQNGVNGYKVTASNGNFIFLPVAGYHYDTGLDFAGSNGYYWSATPLNNNDFAYSLYFSSSGRGHYTGPRYYGLTVRPIYDPQPTEPVAEAVDLGLSVKWASFNVGATKPEEYGGYYAWGETEEGNYGESSLTYNLSKSELQSRGIISEDGNLTAFYDVATTKWGGAWRMPTLAEIQELINKCTWERTTQNGVNGCKVSGSNGNSIFLPCAGLRLGTTFLEVGTYGHCWSASLDGYDIWYAHQLEFDDSSICWDNYGERGNGYTVRPVTK